MSDSPRWLFVDHSYKFSFSNCSTSHHYCTLHSTHHNTHYTQHNITTSHTHYTRHAPHHFIYQTIPPAATIWVAVTRYQSSEICYSNNNELNTHQTTHDTLVYERHKSQNKRKMPAKESRAERGTERRAEHYWKPTLMWCCSAKMSQKYFWFSVLRQ